jgi:hypothetical protein
MLSRNNVCVVSDPYLVALDGLPKLDIIQADFKKSNYKPPLTSHASVDKYLRMDRKNMRACLNEVA